MRKKCPNFAQILLNKGVKFGNKMCKKEIFSVRSVLHYYGADVYISKCRWSLLIIIVQMP